MPQAKIAVVYYSMYGHIRKMAEAVKAGVEEAGHQATLLQVPETLPAEVLGKMHAPPKSDDPVVTLADLEAYDGILFGLPGRYGMYPAQFKAFWDSTGSLWGAGKLIGKPAGVFFSTAQQGGGQETIGVPLSAAHCALPTVTCSRMRCLRLPWPSAPRPVPTTI